MAARTMTVGQLKDVISCLPDDTPIQIYELRYFGYDEYFQNDVVVSEENGILFLTPRCDANIVPKHTVLDPEQWRGCATNNQQR